MSAPRKRRAATAYSPPRDAFDYDADVTKEAIRHIQDRADEVRQGEELEVVEGYVGIRGN